jgi:hypothetical protein
MKKSQSRERYFTSQITTLQGPQTGLSSVKVSQNLQKESKFIESNLRRS